MLYRNFPPCRKARVTKVASPARCWSGGDADGAAAVQVGFLRAQSLEKGSHTPLLPCRVVKQLVSAAQDKLRGLINLSDLEMKKNPKPTTPQTSISRSRYSVAG